MTINSFMRYLFIPYSETPVCGRQPQSAFEIANFFMEDTCE